MTLMSRNNRLVEHNFAHNIVIATVSKTHSSIRPVQSVNWDYHDSTLWIKNGLHATFRIVLAKSDLIENAKRKKSRDPRSCHRLCVNPTIVGAGSRNVDGEIVECVVEGPMVRHISLIVIAEGPTKVIIVSDMPQMYKPIYPFEPYAGGTRDMVARKRRIVLENNKRFVKQIVNSNRKYLNKQCEITSHSVNVLEDVKRTVEIENLEHKIETRNQSTKQCENDTEWYLWIQPVEAFDLRPGSWPILQVQSVYFQNTGVLMKQDKVKFEASCVHGNSGIAQWSEKMESGMCIPLCGSDKRRRCSVEDVCSGYIRMTLIDALWKKNRKRLKQKRMADVLGKCFCFSHDRVQYGIALKMIFSNISRHNCTSC